MKVQGPPGRPGVGTVNQTPDSSQVKNAEANKATAPEERIQVSSLSKLLSRVREPEGIDTAKVERLKSALESGSFKVDHERVAEAMLREEV